jgi:hypothetical protein
MLLIGKVSKIPVGSCLYPKIANKDGLEGALGGESRQVISPRRPTIAEKMVGIFGVPAGGTDEVDVGWRDDCTLDRDPATRTPTCYRLRRGPGGVRTCASSGVHLGGLTPALASPLRGRGD